MFTYFRKTWYFFVFRILLFILEILLFILLADKIQIFLWNFFNMGLFGMIISGFLGSIGAYVLLSYFDRLVLLILKLWNISVFVSLTTSNSSDISTTIANIRKFFPEIGTVVIANSVLRRAAPRVFESIITELEEVEAICNILKFRKNFFVRRLLQNIIDFVDECSIFYVFKHGDNSENSMITLGRGVLFYIKSFPKLLLSSIKVFIFTNLLFFMIFLTVLMLMFSITTGIVGTIYAFLFSILFSIMINRILIELIKMGFMLFAFNNCLEAKVEKNLKDIENGSNRFTEYCENTNDTTSTENIFSDSDNLYADLLASVTSNQQEPIKNESKGVARFKLEQPSTTPVAEPVNHESSLNNKNYKNVIHTYFEEISSMRVLDISKELQKYGITSFDKFF